MISHLARARLSIGLATVAAVALLVTPFLSAAKPSTPQAPIAAEQASPEVQLQIEILTVRQALAEAEQKALEDAALKQAHEELQNAIHAEMRKLDPSYERRVSRLLEIEQELQASDPKADVEPLLTEAQGLQERLVSVQAKVVETEPLKTSIDQMRGRMLDEMTEVNPEVPKLLERLEVLAEQLKKPQG